MPWCTQCVNTTISVNNTINLVEKFVAADDSVPAVSLSAFAALFGILLCFYGFRLFHIALVFIGNRLCINIL